MTASESLADAENSASNDQQRAKHSSTAYHSSIYPAGSEFAVCYAEAQIMSAVVGVLNENLMDGIKGFYKLRKAYMTLDTILEAEIKYTRGKNGLSTNTTRRNSISSLKSTRSLKSVKNMPGGFGDSPPRSAVSQHAPQNVLQANPPGYSVVPSDTTQQEDDDEFYDADEAHEGARTPDIYSGHVETEEARSKMEAMSLQSPITPNSTQTLRTPTPIRSPISKGSDILDHNPNSDVFTNTVDVFIHSGANLCFGLLLLIISLIPPAFSKLLFIIGFRGDRDRGIRLLWQASKFHNIHGAMAGLIVLGYYNGLIGFCDIIPDASMNTEDGEAENLGGYPTHRLEDLLADMRSRYPKSHLWLLEESRMQASNRNLDVALNLLSGESKSPLKQVEALSVFEKSLNAMYSHRYQECADSFIHCCKLNNWSHALYYYIAGSCHVELYRAAKLSLKSTSAEKHAQKAVEYLQTVRAHAGKKKFMARQLPFDVFVVRKLSKWEARAKEWNVPLIDAIGISPVEEMIYFWNGYKRMNRDQLAASLDALAWSEDPLKNTTWFREGLDEKAILAVLRAGVYRNQRRWDDAKTLLKAEVIAHDKALFKGQFKDDWTAPTAHYEMGAILWAQRGDGNDAGKGEDRELVLVTEAQEWVDKASKWDGYELDARIGLKVTTAQETLRKWREGRGS